MSDSTFFQILRADVRGLRGRHLQHPGAGGRVLRRHPLHPRRRHGQRGARGRQQRLQTLLQAAALRLNVLQIQPIKTINSFESNVDRGYNSTNDILKVLH